MVSANQQLVKLVETKWKEGKSPLEIGLILSNEKKSKSVDKAFERLVQLVKSQLPSDFHWVDISFIWSATFDSILRDGCPGTKIRNPRTRRCVKLNGQIGREILKQHAETSTTTDDTQGFTPYEKWASRTFTQTQSVVKDDTDEVSELILEKDDVSFETNPDIKALLKEPEQPAVLLSDEEIEKQVREVVSRVKERGGYINTVVYYTSLVLRSLSNSLFNDDIWFVLITMSLQAFSATLGKDSAPLKFALNPLVYGDFGFKTVFGQNLLYFINRSLYKNQLVNSVYKKYNWLYIMTIIFRSLYYFYDRSVVD